MSVEETAASICDKAAELIHGGDRNAQHGDALDCHENIARLWSAYLTAKFGTAMVIQPVDVAKMMVLLKIARSVLGKHNPDDYVDIVGYGSLAGGIAEATK